MCFSIYSGLINRYFNPLLILILISLSLASIYEDEERVNSEGMWQKAVPHHESAVSTGHGNSRFDVGGILTAAGLKTGGSLLGLVIFPFVFPIVLIFAVALFIISVFGGVSPVVTSGRRFDNNNGDDAVVPGQRRILAADVLSSEHCVERIGCEILDRMGHKTKILRLLRSLKYFPEWLEMVDIAVKAGQSCSHFKCNVQAFARTWEQSYAKYFT